MTQNEKVNDLFQNVLRQSRIRYACVNGFDKYIVFNEQGNLFSVGFNKTAKKYGLGRTELMLKEYEKSGFSHEIMPDSIVLYNDARARYDVYQSMSGELKSVYDLINGFAGKDGKKR